VKLDTRVARLEAVERARPVACGALVPEDPVALARGLLEGTVALADVARAGARHTGTVVRLVAFLGTLTPESQAWLRAERERMPGAYPDAVLLPEDADVVWDRLDAVMRRG
jgi:anti-sigma factor ChrR (cupin superfamily)